MKKTCWSCWLDRILSREGYRVKTANSAYDALDVIDHTHIGVAILDIRMYPIDGIALLAEIQKAVPFDSSHHDDGFSDDGNSEWLQKIRRDGLSRKTTEA